MYKPGSTTTSGYKINDSLYVADDGVFYFRTPSNLIGFMTPGANQAEASSVTLKKGQEIYLEVLTPTVVRSVDGTYHVLQADGTYADATATMATGTATTKTLGDGTQIVAASTEIITVTHNDDLCLIITNYLDGEGNIIFIEHTMSDGTVADSDGNLIPGTGADTWSTLKNTGSTYALSEIVGKDTTVTLADTGTGAALVNGDPKPAIVGDAITIITGEGVSIGADSDPLATAPYSATEAEVSFETLAGDENVITGDVWIDTEGSVQLPDDLRVVEGASYHQSATLDIIYTTIDVAKDALIDLQAGRDVRGVSKADGTEGYLAVAAGGEANLVARRDNVYQHVNLADGTSTLAGGTASIMTAGAYANPHNVVESGSVVGDTAWVGAYGSLVVRNGAGDYTFNAIDAATGSTVDVTADAGITGEKVTGMGTAAYLLSTTGDINSADHYLLVDLPNGNPLTIAHVDDYYLIGADAPGVTVSTGRDEQGTTASGIDMGDVGAEDMVTPIVHGDSAELAQWMLDHIANRDDIVAQLDAAAADPCGAYLANGDAAGFAEWLTSQTAQGAITSAKLADIISQLLTAEDLAALEQDAWGKSTYPSADPSVIDALRDLTIVVGEATGSASVKNLGDVRIDQLSGTMTVGDVTSDLGDVTLSNMGGDIVGAPGETVNVQGADVVLNATGDVGPIVIETGMVDLTVVGSIANEIAGATPKAVYDHTTGAYTTSWHADYRQIANHDKRQTGKIDVTSGGGVAIIEKSGDLGVGVIDAGGHVKLTADSISDVRDAGETRPNITSEGVSLTASRGDVGSTDKPIEIDTNGAGDTADATVNAIACGDVNLAETAGDMRVGGIVAGGDANLIVQEGKLVDADKDNLVSKLAELLEDARIAEQQAESAAESARLREDTLEQLWQAYEDAQAAADVAKQVADEAQATAGQAAQDAADAQSAANQAAQDALTAQAAAGAAKADADAAQAAADQAKADADAAQAAADAVAADPSATQDEIDAAQAAADVARTAADEAQAKADEKRQAADEAQAAADDARRAATDAQAAADDVAAGAADAQRAADDARQAATDAQAAADSAKDAHDELKGVIDAYRQLAEDKAAEAEQRRSEAGDIQRRLDAIEAARDDVKDAQAAANAANDALDALRQQIADELGIDQDDVTDEMLAQQEADAVKDAERVATDANVALEEAKARLDQVLGDTGAHGPSITTGGDLTIMADGVGTFDDPVSTDVGGKLNVNGTFDGGDPDVVNVENFGDLITSPIAATDKIDLTATGNVRVFNSGTGATLMAAAVNIASTGGDVGTKDDPIKVDTDAVDAYGNNVYIESDDDLPIDSVVAEDEAGIGAGGNVTDTGNGAGVVAHSATIVAGGDIGRDDNPLDVNADDLSTTSGGGTNLSLTSPGTNVDATAGGDIDIDSTGAVHGTASAQNVNIDADGDVGSKSKPFVANVTPKTGTATANSGYGGVNLEKHPAKYTITLILNGGTLGGQHGTVTYVTDEGDVLILPLPTRAGYKFLYWRGSVHYAGDEYLVIGDHTFEAVWEKLGGNDRDDEGGAYGYDGWNDGGGRDTSAGTEIPQTGDSTLMVGVGMILLACAGLLLVALGFCRRCELVRAWKL